jgi:hypothetical protein
MAAVTAMPGFDYDDSVRLLARYDSYEEVPAEVLAIHLGDALGDIDQLRAELDLYRSLAERAADMWQPTFGLNPDEGLWVFPWAEDVADEAMTREQVEFYRQRREATT